MIQHITREITASELDESALFYGLLGFERVPAPPGIEGRAAWLEHAGPCPTQIHLLLVDEAAAATRRPSGHVGIVVEEYARVVEQLAAAGHRVEPRLAHWGSPRSYVRDPAGYLVELIAWPPAPRPESSAQ